MFETLVISGGYQICEGCGEVIVNGERAIYRETTLDLPGRRLGGYIHAMKQKDAKKRCWENIEELAKSTDYKLKLADPTEILIESPTLSNTLELRVPETELEKFTASPETALVRHLGATCS